MPCLLCKRFAFAKLPEKSAAILMLAFATLLLVGLAPHQQARADEGEWWSQILGHGGQLDKKRRSTNRRGAKKYKIDDLRKSSIPLRSEEVFDATMAAVQRYEKIVAAGGWKKINSKRMIRPGDSDNRIPIVRERLRATGDLPKSKGGFYYQSYEYDSFIEQGVVNFQKRHGLRITHRIDRATIAAMNVSAADRLRQLKLNLERLRNLITGHIEDRYILVNAAAFQLEAVDRYAVERHHRVIVGKPGRDTPIVKATIKGLNFFPYWHVPESVARKDLIPRLQTEPDYLEKEHIRVFKGSYKGEPLDASSIDWSQVKSTDLFFRQEPGEWNALGLVRIDMPNEHIVYMHDTPMKELFSQSRRAFSAGCVRVQDVFQLVDWIAQKEEGWQQPGRAEQVVAEGQPLDLELTRPIPVYFTYITAWGEPSGPVQFRADIYDRDGAQVYAGELDPEEAAIAPQALAP